MKNLLRALLACVWVVVGWGALAIAAEAVPGQAICLVCQVTRGESEAEQVKAARTHDGREYGFCSEQCAQAFDADPLAYVPPAFPRLAPVFALQDLSGRAVSPKTLKGQVVLIDFWATWCAPCRKSMPELQALQRKYASRGFTVLGISIDEGAANKVKRFVTSRKFTYPIAVDRDSSPAWEAFRVKAVPAAFLLDRDGLIVAQWTGAPPDFSALEQRIEALLGKD